MPGVVAWLNSLLPLAPSQPVWEMGMAVSPSERLGILMSGSGLGKPQSYLQALMAASESWEAPRNPGSQILHSGQHQGPNLTLVGTFTYPAVLLREQWSGASRHRALKAYQPLYSSEVHLGENRLRHTTVTNNPRISVSESHTISCSH